MKSLFQFCFENILELKNVEIISQLHNDLKVDHLPYTLCFGQSDVLTSLRDLIQTMNDSNIEFTKDRKIEVDMYVQAVMMDIQENMERDESFYLLIWHGIKVINEKNQETQFDGIWLSIQPNKYTLSLVEVKGGRSQKIDSARNQLTKGLSKIGVSKKVFKEKIEKQIHNRAAIYSFSKDKKFRIIKE